MKKALFCLLVLAISILAVPTNNPVQQPSAWNGYGVDWMYRSLRVGTVNRDSLLEDGWLLVDTVDAGLITADSLYAALFATDSLYAVYARIESTLIVDRYAYVDTTIFVSDVPYDTLANRRIVLLADSVYNQSQAVGLLYTGTGGTWVQNLDAYVRVEPGDTASVYWTVYAGGNGDTLLLPTSPGNYLLPQARTDTLLVVDTTWTLYHWSLPKPIYFHFPLSYAFYAAGNIDWWLAGMNHDAAPAVGEPIFGLEFQPFPVLAWTTTGMDPIITFDCDSTIRGDTLLAAYDPTNRRYSMYLDEASANVFQARSLGVDYLWGASGTWITNLNNFVSMGFNLMGEISAESISTTDLRVLDDAVIDSVLSVGDSAYFNAEVTINGLVIMDSTLTLNDSLYVADNAFIDGILFADSIDGHSPIYLMSDVLVDSAFYVADSVALNHVGGGTWVGGMLTADSALSVADSSWFSDDLYIGSDLSAEYGQFRTSVGIDSVLWVGDSTMIRNDSTYFHANVTVDNILQCNEYQLISGDSVDTGRNGLPVVMLWTGTVDHNSLTDADTSQDILLVSAFPAKYRILEIVVNVKEKFDDGGGGIDGCTMSVGRTPAAYADLLAATDVYTGTTQIGDTAGEVAYTAVQGGLRLSWSATTDIYAQFITAHGTVADLTTGIATVYILYMAVE